MYINNLIIFSGVAYERVVEEHLFSLVKLYICASLVADRWTERTTRRRARVCAENTKKLVIGVNSGILS